MATVDKNFRIKNGLVVEGSTATVNGSNILTENSVEFLQDTAAAQLTGGTHTNISVSYNDTTGTISLTGGVTYTDEQAQDAVGNAVGTGLSYNDTTGAISVDTSTIQARVADVSDTEIGYLNGVTSSIQTQLNDKAPLASPTFTGTVTLPNNTITNAMMADNSVDTAEIASSAVTTAKIADANVTAAKLASGSIETAKIADGAVTSAKIANDTIVDADINSAAAIAQSKISNLTTDLDAKLPKAGGTMSGAIAMGTNKITGLGNPTSAQDAATKAYVDGVAQGLDVKASVALATTADILANGGTYAAPNDYQDGPDDEFLDTFTFPIGELYIDSTFVSLGDRILVKDQTLSKQNGIFTCTTVGQNAIPGRSAGSGAVLTRSSDANKKNSFTPGLFTFVDRGTVNDAKGFVLVEGGGNSLGNADPKVFTQFSGSGTFTAGNGLTLTGNSFSINTSTTADLSTAQTLTNKTLTSPVINTPTGITKSDVGLANVDNTSDANKPVSSATQTALDLKAPLASPALTGTPTAPTAAADTNTTQIATTAFAKAEADAAQSAAEATASSALSGVTAGTTAFTAVNVNSVAKQIAATTGNIVTAAATTAYAWAKASYRSGEFLVKAKNGNHTEVAKIMVTLDSSDNVYITEYGMSSTSGVSLQTVSADVSGTDVRIRVTPANNNTEVLITGILLV